MLLPMLLMLDSRRSKDFCDPSEVTARPVSCALQRVDILREASLRLRSRTSRRLCDPRIVVGIGGLVEELEARRRLSPEAVRELVTVLSRPRRSEVATEAASASRVASSAALDVLGLMSSPMSDGAFLRFLGVACSKNKSSSSTVCRAFCTSESVPSMASWSKNSRSDSVKVLLLIETFRRRESLVFLEQTETSRDSLHTRVGLGIGGNASVSATGSSLG
mmetsp:Transcript_16274/g.40822  ORF Transcript_16274/g.40822 Transcript_16274/m.40822 type:complete len:220 (-) Transcript_16274:276-935(-)